ncbi:MAG: hypothetical protein M1837_005221 [Sclerophora amabilis]|nr:MAG: hypothetical protein M1837_005221 [Sclerophora amabilis]
MKLDLILIFSWLVVLTNTRPLANPAKTQEQEPSTDISPSEVQGQLLSDDVESTAAQTTPIPSSVPVVPEGHEGPDRPGGPTAPKATAEGAAIAVQMEHQVGQFAHSGSTGIAEASAQTFPSILALNTRTEIAYGMRVPGSSDGCSALSWHTESASLLAQNWDVKSLLPAPPSSGIPPLTGLTRQWQAAQSSALISLRIHREPNSSQPSIHMMTEAGIIGKIGLSTTGVGVCLNAVRHPGVSFSRLPVHLALRCSLRCASATAAVAMLASVGVASACHILIADESMGIGLECSASGVRKWDMDADDGVVSHTNHYIHPVPACQPNGTESKDTGDGAIGIDLDLPDSITRLQRLKTLVDDIRRRGEKARGGGAEEEEEPNVASLERVFEDEAGAPGSICRFPTGKDHVQTLFGVVMDLKARKGWVRIGRPVEPEERMVLDPGENP